jgi:hypothetical protein
MILNLCLLPRSMQLFRTFLMNAFLTSPQFIQMDQSPLSARYTLNIPDLQLSFTSNLPPTSSSFTAECYVITEALKLIQNFPPKNYLIVSDSMSCLQALNSNPFNSHLSPLILRIKFLIFTLNQKNYNISFLWVPSHTGIHGNEVADHLTKSSSNLIFPFFPLLPHSDFTPLLKQHSNNTWLSLWNNLPAEFASRYRNITPNILKKTWFHNLHLHRPYIVQFNRLRIGNHLLPSHSFNLGLNDSPFCKFYLNECIYNLSHILFDCPALQTKRIILVNIFKTLIPL